MVDDPSAAAATVRVLGRLTIERGGTVTDIDPTTNLGVVLAILASRADERVSVDDLADAVWPTRRPVTHRKGLQVIVMRLRGMLDLDRERGDVRSSAIIGHADAYELRCGGGRLDAERFEQAVRAGGRELAAGAAATAADSFRGALALWGDPFGGADVVGLAPAVARLHAARRAAVTGLLEADVQLGREDLAELERAVDDDPFDERRWGHLMVALFRRGRQADALATFQRARTMLVEEIGVEPGPYLRSIEAQVMLQDGPGLLPHGEPVRPVADTWPAPPHRAGPMLLRDAEQTLVAQRLERGRTVTVVGPPGVGKTTLAATIAGTRPSSTVAWLALRTVRAGASAVVDIAPLLGVITEATDPAELVRLIADRIGDRSLLLVLDNAEHVAVPVRDLVAALVRACPNLVVLVTSRRTLGLADEQVTVLEPFATRDLHRASTTPSVSGRFVHERVALDLTSPAELDALEQLCAHVGGLALGLEQVASRLRAFTPTELVARLGILRDDAPGDLEQAIDWSISLLQPDELTMLRGLAFLEGPWPLRRAEAVGGRLHLSPRAAARALGALADQSLIRDLGVGRPGEPQRQLIEPVRHFVQLGVEQLGTTSTFEAACAAAICDEAIEAARLLEGRDQRRALDSLHGLMPDIRRTVEWAAEHGRPEILAPLLAALRGWWWASGLFADGQTLHAVAAPVIDAWAPSMPEDRDARYSAVVSRVATQPGMGGPLAHQDTLRALLADAERFGSRPELRAMAAQQLSCGLSLANRDIPEAVDLAERAVDLARGVASRGLYANALYALALARGRTDPFAALPLFEQAVAVFLEAGDRLHAARMMMFIGHGARLFGNPDDSEAAYTQAEEWCAALGAAPATQLDCLLGRAQSADVRGDDERAMELYRAVVPASLELGARRPAAVAQRGLARLLAARGDLQGASALVARSLELLHASEGEDTELAAAHLLRAEIAMAREQTETAAALLGRAAQLSTGSGVPMELRDHLRLAALRGRLVEVLGAASCAEHEARGRVDPLL